MPKLVEPPGEALPDWKIISLFAYSLGVGANFMYQSAEDIFAEFAALTAGTLCDISGVSYARLKDQGPVQWPCPKTNSAGTSRLYEDARFPTADGKAALIAVEHAPPVESPDENYPLVLTTGRVKHHWHTMTRTGKNAALRRRSPEPILEINRADARRYKIQDADFVEVISRRGKVMVQARVTDEIALGTCFLPFHWSREEGFFKAANNLTISARDPVSRQPELKACAVRVRKVLEFPVDDN
jgi:ferredoxin-nitrate reductase